jgi:ATP-dependent helicase/nuclease subunit A
LRRFPLEAGVSPGFSEIDDRTAKRLRDSVTDALAEEEPEMFDAAAVLAGGVDLGKLIDDILAARDGFVTVPEAAAVRARIGLPPDLDAARLVAETFALGDAALLNSLCSALKSGGASDLKAYDRIAPLICRPLDLAALAMLEGPLLYGEAAGNPFGPKTGRFPTKSVRSALPPGEAEALDDLMERVAQARLHRIALVAVDRTLALHNFSAAWLRRYEDRKRAHGWLDFDDLITGARRLLSDPRVASWVLWRLDGGIDHILVDEAQDTSPAQWDVIRLLAQEFTAGTGTHSPGERTLFVVGDPKQSIYSFQGADPTAFDRMRRIFAERLATVGEHLQNEQLLWSFRSAPGVLGFVDRTFPDGAAAALGDSLDHRAFHAGMPSRIDLWPLVERPARAPDPDWFDPVDLIGAEDPARILSNRIADAIAGMLGGALVPDRHVPGTPLRPIQARDILILVQRRSALFHEIIRALKARGLPVAGADVLRLGGELAVKDLLATLRVLALPEDDLSLAAALRSPLFGWTEDALYRLAQPRGGYLFAALRDAAGDHPETWSILSDLRDRTDYLRPYDLLERLLIRHDGRRRLIGRLGTEAEDGIDALLAQALEYEQVAVPSLTGFLEWIGAQEVTVKRRPEAAGNTIRVMTVHGAKGLESPVVILPDCAKRQPRRTARFVRLDDGLPVAVASGGGQPAVLEEALSDLRDRDAAERLRLLYVALTRAESWLIVAAAGDAGDSGESWYRIVEDGMNRLGAQPDGDGLRLENGDWSTETTDPVPAEKGTTSAEAPKWAAIPMPQPAPRARPRSPSDLGGEKALPGDAGLNADAAMRRGSLVHRLIEVLPGVPADAWDAVATASDPVEGANALAEARGVITHPDHAAIFAPAALAEAPITGQIDGIGRISGVIDRLLVDADGVLAVDFKTNATVPATPADVPEGLLRQMGAYLALLEAIYPDRPISVAILWTRTSTLMPLPHEMVRAALARTPPLDPPVASP